MRKILSLLAVTLCSSPIFAQQLVDGVVAVVGKNIVLKSDVDNRYISNQDQGGVNANLDRCTIFEDLLFEKLLLHQADLDSVVVGDEEVDQAIDRRIQVFVQQIGSVQKLESYYKKSIVEIKEEMRPFIKDQMTAQRMLGEITADVEITPSEVREFYNSIPTDSLPLINSQIEFAQVVKYPKVSKEAKDEAISKLNDLKLRVENGSSFSTLAILYSEDPGSAKNGGEYKGIKRGQFVKEFEAVAFNLAMGEISEPFSTIYGYHIVQLQVRRGEELDLRHILIKPKISAEDLEVTKQFLDSLRTEIISSKLSFEKTAKDYSEDENSKLNGGLAMNPQTGDSRWETGQMDREIFYATEKLSIGRISEPIFFRTPDGKEGFKLIKLINKTKPHRADLKTDYNIIQNVALQEKRNEATQKWIEEKLKATYVRVNNEYFECEFDRGWIKKSQYIE
tara:strand:- start:370 stop:1719 length:1350 start_codon:yes stop_codon:yes gene_type:complete